MRGSSLEGMLLYEAKVKPAIKELVDKVYTMTDQEIDASIVPLPWFKQALKQYRDALRARELGDQIDACTSLTSIPDYMGKVVEWKGDTIFAKTSPTMFLEVSPGTLVFLGDNLAWIGSTYCSIVDPRFVELPVITEMTRSQYISAYKAVLASRV